MRSFLFVLGSARPGGNTEALARIAAAELPAETPQRWLALHDLSLSPFEDVRHTGTGSYPEPTGDMKTLLDATLECTDLVIASPLYWYSVTASVKLYLDHWSAWMRVPGADFKDRMRGKTMWAVTSVSDSDLETTNPLRDTLRLSADYLSMHWGGFLYTISNRPGDIKEDSEALVRAKRFFG